MSMRDEVVVILLRKTNIRDATDAIMRVVEPDEEKMAEVVRRTRTNERYIWTDIMVASDLLAAWKDGKLSKPPTHRCPTCDVTQPDAWCGACGKEIPKTYGAAGMSEAAVDNIAEKVREANTPSNCTTCIWFFGFIRYPNEAHRAQCNHSGQAGYIADVNVPPCGGLAYTEKVEAHTPDKEE